MKIKLDTNIYDIDTDNLVIYSGVLSGNVYVPVKINNNEYILSLETKRAYKREHKCFKQRDVYNILITFDCLKDFIEHIKKGGDFE